MRHNSMHGYENNRNSPVYRYTRTAPYLPPWAKLRVPSDLSFDWELVNRLPKIQTEAEFSIPMSEHFIRFPFGGMSNYTHGGKGPFRTSY